MPSGQTPSSVRRQVVTITWSSTWAWTVGFSIGTSTSAPIEVAEHQSAEK
jgi:hypothetical protein